MNVNPAPGSDYSRFVRCFPKSEALAPLTLVLFVLFACCARSKVVEVIGRVVDSETIQEFKATLFGEDFDLETYDQLVQLAQSKYRGLFD